MRTVLPVVTQNVPFVSVAASVSFAVQADRLLLGVGEDDGDTLPLPVSDFVPPQPVRASARVATARDGPRIDRRMGGLLCPFDVSRTHPDPS
jgi:7-cyano-7-deazaguanine synthase in queuosine biosynthesis